jgi:hypothetical protein
MTAEARLRLGCWAGWGVWGGMGVGANLVGATGWVQAGFELVSVDGRAVGGLSPTEVKVLLLVRTPLPSKQDVGSIPLGVLWLAHNWPAIGLLLVSAPPPPTPLLVAGPRCARLEGREGERREIGYVDPRTGREGRATVELDCLAEFRRAGPHYPVGGGAGPGGPGAPATPLQLPAFAPPWLHYQPPLGGLVQFPPPQAPLDQGGWPWVGGAGPGGSGGGPGLPAPAQRTAQMAAQPAAVSAYGGDGGGGFGGQMY